jgi:stearoyl-CoA desaturase (delta-9 desaturase)
MSVQIKLHLWHLFNHALAFTGLIYIGITSEYWWFIFAYTMFILSGMVGVNIGLHRYLSHKSFVTGKRRDIFLKYLSMLSGLGSPIVWVAMHRHHHATSDTIKDIQAPSTIGVLRAWFLDYNPATFGPSIVRDIMSCHHSKFIHKYYFRMLIVLYVLVACINPLLTVFLLAVPAVLSFHGAAALGVLTHLWGYRVVESKDNSYNNILASILSLGEGWHNYHHMYPTNYQQGHRWFEFDPAAHIIRWFFKIDKKKEQ